MRRVLALLVCAMALELGWLALWPLSTTLSHSALFTSTLLSDHPALALFGEHLPGWTASTLTDPLGSASYGPAASALALLMVYLMAMYGLSLLLLDGLRISPRACVAIILGAALVFQATLVALPGLFSQDVFSYIAYGRLAAVYDLNPYIWPPDVLRDPVVQWVADGWRTYASPYGPVEVAVQWLLARIGSELSFADQALVYRALANALLLVNLGLLWRVLGRLTPLNESRRIASFAAVAWNPLILFEIAANAHNDVLMVTFTLLALLLFRASSRGVRATLALSLGALVKYLSGLGLIWLGFAAAARARSWPRRGLRLGILTLLSLGVALLIAAPWLELPDSLDPLVNETARVGYVNSLPDTFVVMLVSALGMDLDSARFVERLLIYGGFALYLIWEVRQVWADPNRGGVARALARSSLIYVLLVSMSVQTWYFCLPLTVALGLGWRRRIARLTLAYSALALPALYLSYYLRELTPGWVFVAYAVVPLVALAPRTVTRRTSRPSRQRVSVQPTFPPSTAVRAPAPRAGSNSS
jgi:hypothetical protein